MAQADEGAGMATPKRTERDVLLELTTEQQQFLKRVLEIERAKLHVKAADLTDDLLGAVKAILP
jgi:DNA-binding MarR family transcriptional regulator